MKRTDRVGAIIRILSQHPNKVYSLSYFCDLFGAAKSSVSEDVAAARDLLERMELGRIETIAGAKGVIINIKSSPDIALDEIDTASQLITERASEDANIIWGAAFDDSMEDEMMVTVIATGFDGMNGENNAKAAAPAISDADLFSTPSASRHSTSAREAPL